MSLLALDTMAVQYEPCVGTSPWPCIGNDRALPLRADRRWPDLAVQHHIQPP